MKTERSKIVFVIRRDIQKAREKRLSNFASRKDAPTSKTRLVVDHLAATAGANALPDLGLGEGSVCV